MQAAVKVDERKEYILEERPIPKPGPEQALVKVITTGICGTDVAIRSNVFMGRHGPVKMPIVPGHEFYGEVVEVGAKVRHVKVGDRVTCSAIRDVAFVILVSCACFTAVIGGTMWGSTPMGLLRSMWPYMMRSCSRCPLRSPLKRRPSLSL